VRQSIHSIREIYPRVVARVDGIRSERFDRLQARFAPSRRTDVLRHALVKLGRREFRGYLADESICLSIVLSAGLNQPDKGILAIRGLVFLLSVGQTG
jgi:hypothetical protein